MQAPASLLNRRRSMLDRIRGRNPTAQAASDPRPRHSRAVSAHVRLLGEPRTTRREPPSGLPASPGDGQPAIDLRPSALPGLRASCPYGYIGARGPPPGAANERGPARLLDHGRFKLDRTLVSIHADRASSAPASRMRMIRPTSGHPASMQCRQNAFLLSIHLAENQKSYVQQRRLEDI